MDRLFRQFKAPDVTLTDYEALSILLGSRAVNFDATAWRDGTRHIQVECDGYTAIFYFDAEGKLTFID